MTFTLGEYTVREAVRPDNPYFPQWLVYLGERLIGKNFSRPSLGDCRWLEHYQGRYARNSRWPETSDNRPIWNAAPRRGRPRMNRRGVGSPKLVADT